MRTLPGVITTWYLITAPRTDRSHPAEARQRVGPFIRKIRRLYRKAGAELKYVEACEFGEKGALHHHIILNHCSDVTTEDIRKKWSHGRIHFNLMDDDGEYSRLAAYIVKNRKYWRKAGGTGKQHTRSRNLRVPETKKTIIRRSDGYYEKPRVKKGYYLAPETETHLVHEGGYSYTRYILVEAEGRAP